MGDQDPMGTKRMALQQHDVSGVSFTPATSVDFSKDHFTSAEYARTARRDSLLRMQKLAATYDTLQEQLQHMAKREPVSALTDRTNAAVVGGGSVGLPPAGKPPVVPTHGHLHHHATAGAGLPPTAATQQHQDNQDRAHAAAASAQPGATACGDRLLGSTSACQALTAGDVQLSASAAASTSSTGTDTLFDFAPGYPGSQVHQHAVEILQARELLELCEDGLQRQLTRTKDGATERSRIQELAALVKLLRKCVREMATRTSCFVDQVAKIERENAKQVQSLQLTSESTLRSVQAELAGAKKDLAQYEAMSKMDKAKWGADLEDQRYEGIRLKRELERVIEERDRSREECARAESAWRSLEQDFKDHSKHSAQTLRDQSSESAAALAELKDAADQQEAAARASQDECARLAKRLELSQSCVGALKGELAMTQQLYDKAKDALRAKGTSEEQLTQQVDELSAQLAEARQKLAAASSEVGQLNAQLTETNARGEAAEASASEALERVGAAREQLAEAQATLQQEQTAWAQTEQDLRQRVSEAAAREASLLDEQTRLSDAVSAGLARKDELEVELATLHKAHSGLQFEEKKLRNQIDFVTGSQSAAEERATRLQGELSTAHAELAGISANMEAKEVRLQELEGEFGALKEVLGESGQHDVVNNLLRKISTLQMAVASSDAARRKLHNELVETRGNIRVFCRVRPSSAAASVGSSVRCLPDQCGLAIAVDDKDHSLEFDRVFSPSASQEDVFAGVSELVQSALDGYHVCLFSYGQTGAGKTYTMQGSDAPDGRGIVPRAVEKILSAADKLAEQEWEYNMEASFVEIYNNQLRDLLGGPSAPYISDTSSIKHDAGGGHTTVAGVSKVRIADAATARQLIARAADVRASEATAMNATSSRSHSVFMLYISGAHPPSGTTLRGCLSLVDLAGSERLDRSLAEGQRKAEACAINASLSSIGDVFAALSSKSSHVPYRNSKLTYLLQPCLGGNGKTLMFVNINPDPASAYESLCSLRFAQKVNGCETQAKGGARRNATTTSTSAPASSSGLGAAEPATGVRLSLPGLPKPQASEPAAKRMSLALGNKRNAAGGGLPSGGAPKRMRPGGTFG